jgi:multiple sugar transport system ATP-binding protein
VAFGIRPEDIKDAALASDHPTSRRLRAHVRLTEALGSALVVHFAVDAPPVVTEDVRDAQRLDDDLQALETGTMCVASFEPRSTVRPGDDVELAIDTRRVHLFDPVTGDSLG